MIHCQAHSQGSGTAVCDLPTALAIDGATGPLLVIAPHDDDAVLGCGLTIQAAREAGMEVHIAVVTDGRMGYVDPDERPRIAALRRTEMLASSACLGVPEASIHFFDFPDGGTGRWAGVHETDTGLDGICVRICALFRSLRPAAVCVPTPADLHPDHRVTTAETEIACFHAQSAIWRELGPPCRLPMLLHYAVYCPFDREPTVLLHADSEAAERRLQGIKAFASQPTIIASLVERLQQAGPIELLAHRPWPSYDPRRYVSAFQVPAGKEL